MIIDAHQHVFWHKRDDAGLIADMDDHRIDVAWLLTWEIARFEDSWGTHGSLNPMHIRPDGTHAGIVLADGIIARDRYPDRFVLGYCPHPVLGDALYGDAEALGHGAPRQMLHAARLRFEEVDAESPDPADFTRVLSEVRR